VLLQFFVFSHLTRKPRFDVSFHTLPHVRTCLLKVCHYGAPSVHSRHCGLFGAFESSLVRSFVRVWSPFVLSLGQYEIRTFVGLPSIVTCSMSPWRRYSLSRLILGYSLQKP